MPTVGIQLRAVSRRVSRRSCARAPFFRVETTNLRQRRARCASREHGRNKGPLCATPQATSQASAATFGALGPPDGRREPRERGGRSVGSFDGAPDSALGLRHGVVLAFRNAIMPSSFVIPMPNENEPPSIPNTCSTALTSVYGAHVFASGLR